MSEPGTLAFCIEAFHRRNPDFVAVLPCMEPSAVALPLVPRPVIVAAARLGITVAEYRRRQADGLRYCSYGEHLAPDWWIDGRRTRAYCPDHMSAYRQEARQLQRDRRVS